MQDTTCAFIIGWWMFLDKSIQGCFKFGHIFEKNLMKAIIIVKSTFLVFA